MMGGDGHRSRDTAQQLVDDVRDFEGMASDLQHVRAPRLSACSLMNVRARARTLTRALAPARVYIQHKEPQIATVAVGGHNVARLRPHLAHHLSASLRDHHSFQTRFPVAPAVVLGHAHRGFYRHPCF